MIRTMRTLLLPILMLGIVIAVACGNGGQDGSDSFLRGAAGPPGAPALAIAPAATADEAFVRREFAVGTLGETVIVEKEVIREVEVAGETVITQAASAPRSPLPTLGGSDDARTQGSELEAEVALVSQNRVIVRTVRMDLEVADVAGAVDAIGDIAEDLGGWVVSSDRSRKHRGSISMRVPAEDLDEVIAELRDMASEVNSEVSTSRDVTDEFVDTTARLNNLEATESALLKLLDRADKVEELLKVQQEVTRTQGQIEQLEGRLKLLRETSAFSLVTVNLELEPMEMDVDPGPEKTFSVGQVARFRASFTPPEDIEDFTFTWDFGDGSRPITSNRTAPSPEEGTRFTATVNHIYSDDRDSPFIAEIEITGTGDAGIVEGKQTVIVTVTKVPTIEVFAGQSQSVENGDEVEFAGSFTRPEGLSDLKFEWSFGDGSLPVTGSLAEGVTNALATHEYTDHRPFPYRATLTITAQGDAGEVEAISFTDVFVSESEGWVIAGWSASDRGKTAVRTLSGVGQAAGTVLIWVAIFSPVWLIVAAIAYRLWRRARRSLNAVADAEERDRSSSSPGTV
jgi:hypothetical protein